MKRALKWTFGLLFRNFWWKLLSLAIAFGIWAMVASEPEVATFVNVRLEYRNLPDDLEISSEPGFTSISLELRGSTGQLRALGEDGIFRPGVVLDMSGVGPGARTFTIGKANVRLPRGVRLVRAIPSEVRFEFDRDTPKTVPVAVDFTGSAASGYVVERHTVTPATIKIQGPAGRVAKVREAFTDPVDVSNVFGKAEFRVNVFVNDPYVRIQSKPQVTVAVQMKKK